MKKTSIIYAAFLMAGACFYLPASAQKLPNKQTASVWAPANIKIDGKADEWNNTYQAFNTATEMYYTISNDDKNLYLTTYITDVGVLFYKAMTGGTTFIIKNNDQEVSFRFPVFATRPSFARLLKTDTLTGKADDPFIVKDNALFVDRSKQIEVTGVSGIDNTVSIYNELGIKAAGHFDVKQGYTYELAIPLKYLGFITAAKPTFSYQIMLNGGKSKFNNTISIGRGMNADGTPFSQAENDAAVLRVQTGMAARFATTDFTGEYTLAKKP